MFKSSIFVAVDYNEDYLQMMQVELIQQTYTISNYVYMHLHTQAAKCPSIKQIKSLKFKTNKVKIAISDEDVISKSLAVSCKLTEKDLQELVKIEVAKLTQGNLEDYGFDYQSTIQKEKREILLVVAKKNILLSKINYLANLGLEVVSIDLKSSCIYRLLKNMQIKNLQNLVCVWFDINQDKLITYIFYQQQLIFVNTESVQNNSEDVFLKVERNLKYLQMHKSDLPIDKIFLLGDTTLVSSIQASIMAISKVKVLIPDILNGFTIRNINMRKNIQASLNKLSISLGLVL